MSRHKKSSRREMSESSDENISEKVTKHKYHSSDAHRRNEKYKKIERSSKYKSASSSESNGHYDPRKVSRSYHEQRTYRAKEMDDYESLSKDYTKHSKRNPTPEKYENSRHSRYSKQLDESGSKSDEAMDCDSFRNKLKRKKETEAETIDDGDNGSLRTNIELEVSEKNDVEPLSKRSKIGNINMRTGGAYIPPAKLKMMQEKIKDKNSEEYQRIAWEALKKSIVGMTNKVNSSNLTEIVRELFKENIIRGRGVLVRAIMQAQAASPTFTKVYASLVSVINSKFPEIGDLLLNRLIMQYRRGFRRKDKIICLTAARFLAHLFNQDVVHEILIFEIVAHLMYKPTEDFVEIAIAVLKECGKKLTQESPKAMRATTQTVRDALHAGTMDMRTQYMIEVFFAIQKDQFKDFETVSKELDLVEEEDKYTHDIKLDDSIDVQEMLNVFKFDPEYLDIEEKYKAVVREILGDSDDEDGDSGAESDSEGEDENDEETKEDSQKIIDMTETNIVCLRRKIYLTIQSSLDFEECAHKLLKLELKPGQILEMCYMILDCCAQQRSYEKFFGLLAQRFCQMNKVYVEPFTQIFENSYKTIHRLETNKLRNVAKFFAHLLYTDAISWTVLAIIKLNEEDTTSSSRIFIKILFQELCEYMGLPKLNERVKDVTLQEAFDGLFPRDHPHNTRFAINFFTSIGLGGLTDELREHLKNLPKTAQNTQQQKPLSSSSASSSSSSSSSSED